MNTNEKHTQPGDWRELWNDIWIPAALIGGPVLVIVGFVAWLYGIEALLRLLGL
jgi:hypothetical protein